ncbi:hypothetical protein [Sinorhizobium meliloti]|uniref:hypothetical protein n=1 Tax=Rhizobium meliloti TaxID=382 RepID=UPI001912E8E5|nr:hypothetical protein [Sinorhizobium meliloti]
MAHLFTPSPPHRTLFGSGFSFLVGPDISLKIDQNVPAFSGGGSLILCHRQQRPRVELLELALKSLDGHGAKGNLQPELLQTVANYKGEMVFRRGLCGPADEFSTGAAPKAEKKNPAEQRGS